MVNLTNDRKLTIIIILHVLSSWTLLAIVLELEQSRNCSSSVIGYIAVLGASLSFGGTGLPMKYEALKDRNVDPSVFSLYTTIGLFLVTSPFLLYLLSVNSFIFLPMSLLGAIFISIIGYFSYIAVQILGYAKAPAIWAGIGMITAYLWGLVYFKEHSNNILISTLAIFMLSLGVYCVSTSQASNTSTELTAGTTTTSSSSSSSSTLERPSYSPSAVFKKLGKVNRSVGGGGAHQAISNTDDDDYYEDEKGMIQCGIESGSNYKMSKLNLSETDLENSYDNSSSNNNNNNDNSSHDNNNGHNNNNDTGYNNHIVIDAHQPFDSAVKNPLLQTSCNHNHNNSNSNNNKHSQMDDGNSKAQHARDSIVGTHHGDHDHVGENGSSSSGSSSNNNNSRNSNSSSSNSNSNNNSSSNNSNSCSSNSSSSNGSTTSSSSNSNSSSINSNNNATYNGSTNKSSQHAPSLSVSLDFLSPHSTTVEMRDSDEHVNDNCINDHDVNIDTNENFISSSSSSSSSSVFAAFSPLPNKFQVRHQPLAQQEDRDDDDANIDIREPNDTMNCNGDNKGKYMNNCNDYSNSDVNTTHHNSNSSSPNNSNNNDNHNNHNRNHNDNSPPSPPILSVSPPSSIKTPSRYHRHYSNNRSSHNSSSHNSRTDLNADDHNTTSNTASNTTSNTTSFSFMSTPYPSEFINRSRSPSTSPNRLHHHHHHHHQQQHQNSNHKNVNNNHIDGMNKHNNNYNNSNNNNDDDNDDNDDNDDYNDSSSNYNSPLRSPSRPLLPELNLQSVKGYSPQKVRSKLKKIQQGDRINYMIDTTADNKGNSCGSSGSDGGVRGQLLVIKRRSMRLVQLFFMPFIYIRNTIVWMIIYLKRRIIINDDGDGDDINNSNNSNNSSGNRRRWSSRCWGYLFCFLTGFLDGSLMLPFKLSLHHSSCDDSDSNSKTSSSSQQQSSSSSSSMDEDIDTPLRYICSLGISALFISPFLFLLYTVLIRSNKQRLNKHHHQQQRVQQQQQQQQQGMEGGFASTMNTNSSSSSSPSSSSSSSSSSSMLTDVFDELHVAFFPGLCSGALWASANVMSVKATYYLGIKVGFPLTQTCILFAALWGVFYFKEMDVWHSGYGFRFSVGIVLVLLGAYALGTSSS